MKYISSLVLFHAFILVPFTAKADINEVFEKFYYSKEISPRHCGVNVQKFIQTLVKEGHYDPDMKMLYFEAPANAWGFYHVVAVNSRWGKTIGESFHENWVFHVVAVHKGLVYDFSFNKKPLILPLEKYFEKMLVPKKPIALYGMDFRIRGQGPYYTPETARMELPRHEFKIIHADQHGRQSVVKQKLDYQQMLHELY